LTSAPADLAGYTIFGQLVGCRKYFKVQ